MMMPAREDKKDSDQEEEDDIEDEDSQAQLSYKRITRKKCPKLSLTVL